MFKKIIERINTWLFGTHIKIVQKGGKNCKMTKTVHIKPGTKITMIQKGGDCSQQIQIM